MSAPPTNRADRPLGTTAVDRINVGMRFGTYVRSLFRRWWIVFLTLGIGGGLGAYFAYTLPDVFRAQSVLAVVPKVVLTNPDKAQVSEDLATYYETQVQYMLSSAVLQRVLDRTAGFRVGRPELDIENVSFRVNLAGKGSGAFQMIVESADFDYCLQFARIWADEFLIFKQGLAGRAIDRAAESLLKEADLYQRLVETNRNRFLEFQQTNNIASAKEVGDSAQQRLDRVLDEYMQRMTRRKLLENLTKEELASSVFERGTIPSLPSSSRDNAAAFLTSGTADPLQQYTDTRTGELMARSQTKQAELDQLTHRLRPKHPHMIQLREEVELLKRQVDSQLDQIEAKRLATIESLRKEEASYEALIEELKQQVFESRTVQQEFDNLREQGDRYATTFDSLRRQIEAINLTARTEERIDVLESGVGLPEPVKPNRLRILLLGILAGLAAGLGLTYFLHTLDDRVENADDAERFLALPMLAQVPRVKRPRGRNGPLFFPAEEAHSMFGEAFRGLRSAITLGAANQPHQVLLITSTAPGEGKTTVAANFAASLALSGCSTLLVDADLRRGNIHHCVGAQPAPGLADVLAGTADWADITHVTQVKDLWILACGRATQNPGELLTPNRIGPLIEALRKEFNFVVIDCPPLLAVDDAFALVGQADGTLMVLKHHFSSLGLVKDALADIALRNGHAFGLVLNSISLRSGRHYYYNYYYEQYHTEGDGADGKARKPKRKKRRWT
jgi:capsular exopolysaccharide synthesis family protein